MWKFKIFRKRSTMNTWIEKHGKSNQWVEVFVNNAYCIEYRLLRKVYQEIEMLHIEVLEEQLTRHKILFCTHCGTWTNHALSRSFEYYMCHCGTCVEIDVIEKESE